MINIKKILVLAFICIYFINGCTEDFDKNNLTLSQCRTYINELITYLDNNIEPMNMLSDAEVGKLPGMINSSIIEEINNFAKIATECQFIQGRDKADNKIDIGKEYEYHNIHTGLIRVKTYMVNIKENEAESDKFLMFLFGHLKKNYLELKNILLE